MPLLHAVKYSLPLHTLALSRDIDFSPALGDFVGRQADLIEFTNSANGVSGVSARVSRAVWSASALRCSRRNWRPRKPISRTSTSAPQTTNGLASRRTAARDGRGRESRITALTWPSSRTGTAIKISGLLLAWFLRTACPILPAMAACTSGYWPNGKVVPAPNAESPSTTPSRESQVLRLPDLAAIALHNA